MADAAARSDPADLVANLAAARDALVEAERLATEELIAAKAAYRDDPNPDTRERKVAAVEDIQALRAAVRADRPAGPGAQVGGDAYLSPEQNEG